MAYFTKRKGKWRVEVNKRGHPRVSKTFISKETAIKWARDTEVQMDKGIFEDCSTANTTTLKDLFIKYRDEIVIHHKAKSTVYRINLLIRHKISQIGIVRLKSSHIHKFKNELKETKASKTVNIYIQLMKAVWNTARKVWSLPLPSSSPFDLVALDKIKNTRDVVLAKDEYKHLLECASRSKLLLLGDLIQFAYQTGARFNEIISLKKVDTNFDKKTATFRETKNGEDRTIPLSNETLGILKKYPFGDRFFNVSVNRFTFYWRQCRSRAGLNHFRFHDLRACFCTNALLSGMSIAEVSAISGHKDWSMLKRYTRIKPEDLLEKINKIEKVIGLSNIKIQKT